MVMRVWTTTEKRTREMILYDKDHPDPKSNAKDTGENPTQRKEKQKTLDVC